MSIESSSTASSPKMLLAVESNNPKDKGKVKSGEESDDVPGGFLALMTAIDSQIPVVTDVAVLATQPQAGLDLQVLTPESLPVGIGATADPADLSSTSWPSDLALLLAQAGAVGVNGAIDSGVGDSLAGVVRGSVAPKGLQRPLLVSSAPDPAAAAAQAVPLAQTLPVDAVTPKTTAVGAGAIDLLSPASRGPVPATKGGVHVVGLATGKAEPPQAAVAPLSSLKPGDSTQTVDALLEQSVQTLSALSNTSKVAGFQPGVNATVVDARALQQAGRADLGASDPTAPGALLTSAISDIFLRPAQRSGNKFSVLSAGAGIEGSWGHQALLAGDRATASVALTSASVQSPESMVADTVSYWVTQGVQNAELKLDGFGGEPVEVRISLKGDQAHIGFRTDQPEIRQMLEGAIGQLKDILKSEGLVLSGVSVGTSGHDGAGAQEQRNRPSLPQVGQASLMTTDQVPTPSQPRVNLAVGRAVDLFV